MNKEGLKTRMITKYDAWFQRISSYGNRGSFITALFEAYQRADMHNKRRLEVAFPEEFVIQSVESLQENQDF